MLKLISAGIMLVFVVALIFATAALGRWLNPWLASRFGTNQFRFRHAGKSDGHKLMCQVDPRRRLYVAELDGCRFAVLTGGPNDVMIALAPHSQREHEP